MGAVFKKSYTKPLPPGVEFFVRKGERFARWKDGRDKPRVASVTRGRDGKERLLLKSGTYTAKYRTANGIVEEVSTGCRDERAARNVLAELERRAELVRSGVISMEEEQVANHQKTLLLEHLGSYLASMEASGVSKTHRADTKRLAKRVFRELGFDKLSDISAESVESWMNARTREGMAARTRNSYLQAIRGFLNWCVSRRRLKTNPLSTVERASEREDRRRTRRALTAIELRRLLHAARYRPLAEHGRETVLKSLQESSGRKTWKKAPLTFETLGAALGRAKERLRENPGLINNLELLGLERALMYKTLALTGLRQGELGSLTIGQLHLDDRLPFVELKAANEKNREGSHIPLRADLVADLREWLSLRAASLDGEIERSGDVVPFGQEMEKLPNSAPLFNVPEKLVKILDRDLALAGIEKRDDRGRTVDVHALRHTYGSHLSSGGVSPRTAQAAMRHSKIDLTMNVYTDPRLLDIHGALDALPDLPLEQVVADDNNEQATGTDERSPLAPTLAPNRDHQGTLLSFADKTKQVRQSDDGKANRAKKPVSAKEKRPLSFVDSERHKRGRRDLNPQPPDRQSGTLTN